MKKAFFFVMLSCALLAQGTLGRTGEHKPGEISPQQAVALWQRVGDSREPFLDSAEAHQEPQSLYRFFNKKDYYKLMGNPVLGYFHYTHEFKWVGKSVAWGGIKPLTDDAKPIRAQAWDAAMAYIAKARGWAIDKRAPIRVEGACVGAVLEPSLSEPFRGVCIEVKVHSPGGVFLYRYSVGKAEIEDAIGAALDWVLCSAMNVNQEASRGTPKP